MTTGDEPTRRIEVTSTWQPVSQPAPSAAPPQRQRVLSADTKNFARLPLIVLAITNAVVFALIHLPKLDIPPAVIDVLGQIQPLLSPLLVRVGTGVSVGLDAIAIAFLGAIVLAWIVRTRMGTNIAVVSAAALLTAAPLIAALLMALVDHSSALQEIAAGMLLGVLALVAAGSVLWKLIRNETASAGSAAARMWWLLIGYAVIFVAPLAVGRAAAGSGLLNIGNQGWQVYLAGLALGATAWALIQIVPPVRLTRVRLALTVLAIFLGPALEIATTSY